MSMNLISIIEWWNDQVKLIKITYHYVISLYSERIIYDRNGYRTMNILSGKFVIDRRWWQDSSKNNANSQFNSSKGTLMKGLCLIISFENY